MIIDISYAARAVGALPHEALTKAGVMLLRSGWRDAIVPNFEEAVLLSPAGEFDVVGTIKYGAPPVFGQYSNCDAERRCVGCHRACHTETALVDLAEVRRRPLLVFIAGMPSSTLTWLRVIAIAPGYSWSGKVFIPSAYRDPEGMTLACERGSQSLVVRRTGLAESKYEAGSPWLAAGFDQALAAFSRAIPNEMLAEWGAHKKCDRSVSFDR